MPQTSLLWLCSGEVWGRDKDLLKLQTMCISASVSFYVCMCLFCVSTLVYPLTFYNILDLHFMVRNSGHTSTSLSLTARLFLHLTWSFETVYACVQARVDFLALQLALKDIKNRGEKCKIEQIKRMKLFMLHCRMTQKTVVLVTFLWEYRVPKHTLWAPCVCICATLLVPMGSIKKV